MFYKSEKKRLIIATLIVLVIIFLVFISSFFEKQKDFDNLFHADIVYSSELPNNFTSEVLDINQINARDIKVSENNKIVGFNLPFSAEKSFEILKTKLYENNWTCVDNNNFNYANFVKPEGEYTWLFLNCINVSGGCSVIFTRD